MPSLVEYSPGTINHLHTGGSLHYASRNRLAPNSIFRLVRLVPPLLSLASLECILERTDEELNTVAELCGATVVPHQWGTYYLPGSDYSHRRLPTNHVLVAKVDRIQTEPPHTVPEPTLTLALQGIDKYYSRKYFSRYRLSDIRTAQFVYGTNQQTKASEPELFLTDIEPRFRAEIGFDLS